MSGDRDRLHALHDLARCPYHVDGDPLSIERSDADGGAAIVRCVECGRRYPVEDGIYRLMPDELRSDLDASLASDAATLQKRREMEQRDQRAGQRGGFHRVDPASTLYWMNVQYEAVTRLAVIDGDGLCVDFGTGVGRYMAWLLRHAPRAVGTDFSFASLRLLHDSLTADERTRCLLVQCDLSRPGLAPGAARSGLCVEVLQHLPRAELRRAAVDAMARSLAPGGDLFLVTKAFCVANRVASALQYLKWRMLHGGDGRGSPPALGQEEIDGAIYTYWYRYRELIDLVRSRFDVRRVAGIISFEAFPIRYLSIPMRLRLDATLEKRWCGRLFGRDMFLWLKRRGTAA